MSTFRVLVVLSLCLLSGCLVTFKDPIVANEAAPLTLLGQWQRHNAWGELEQLQLTRSGTNVYQARLIKPSESGEVEAESYSFTVSHHGRRWYVCAGVPKKHGGNFAMAGFELLNDNLLVVYEIDTRRIRRDMQQGLLEGQDIEELEDGVLITSPLEQVFAYLDDPANADLFSELARYRREQ